jgi:predicted MFS family arabinose efflux permease
MFVNVPIGAAVWSVGRVVLTETGRRGGRFDIGGAVTSVLGMTGIVLGLVQAGSAGWGNPVTIGPLVAGGILLGAFVLNERRAEEPIVPLRLLLNPVRSSANAARGLVYAGMYAVLFFLSQFLQDVGGYSPLHAGIAFLPVPVTVFLASQLTSKVLLNRISQKTVMLAGITAAAASLVAASRLSAASGYAYVLMILILLGAGAGVSLVSLTAASLAGVEPADAGAASGLTNVVQQVGAALGLAVLVTVFDAVTHHAPLARLAGLPAGHRAAVLTHGLDDVFAVAAALALGALLLVAVAIRPRSGPAREPVPVITGTGDADEELWSAA